MRICWLVFFLLPSFPYKNWGCKRSVEFLYEFWRQQKCAQCFFCCDLLLCWKIVCNRDVDCACVFSAVCRYGTILAQTLPAIPTIPTIEKKERERATQTSSAMQRRADESALKWTIKWNLCELLRNTNRLRFWGRRHTEHSRRCAWERTWE